MAEREGIYGAEKKGGVVEAKFLSKREYKATIVHILSKVVLRWAVHPLLTGGRRRNCGNVCGHC